MSFVEAVPYVDLIGYLGAAVTVWGLFQRTMIPLRAGAVLGNVGFVFFGLLAPSYPTLVLHALLLPLNGFRLWQMIRLVREMREAAGGDNSLDALLPFMRKEKAKAGEVLFRQGDPPDRMIIIESGTVDLTEIGVTCTPGDVLGEIAAFTPDNRRTCSAVCETDCELFTLSVEAMVQLFHQNPRFGMFLVRVIVQRLVDNWQDADARARALMM